MSNIIKDNLEKVNNDIEISCNKSNRNKDDVTLIAVSKLKPVEDMKQAIECGIKEFGENYVQELVSKYEELKDFDIKFHMIGHLQRNKVKYIIDKVEMIHSVDSIRLAEEISKQAVKSNVDMKILLEVNMACEETKWGFKKEEVLEAVSSISKLPNIKICGLMTSAPNVDDAQKNRLVFQNMQKLLLDIKSKKIDNVYMYVLSMGMSKDYNVAIEEGATHIRVGTNIFGARDYNK